MAVVIAIGRLMLPQRAPPGTMLDDPVEKRLFEANVMWSRSCADESDMQLVDETLAILSNG
jgi:hypothetical protein